MADPFDLMVIGAGPGGYIAAIRAAQLGFKVACVEKRASLGGTCLNVGCIPSKALLDSSELYEQARHRFAKHGIKFAKVELDLPAMLKRKDEVVKGLTGGVASLFKKNNVTRIHGLGRLKQPGEVEVIDPEGHHTIFHAKSILLATGSEPTTLPFMPFDGHTIVSSTEALSFAKVPEHLLVVGAGYIGLELGSVWSRLGAKVTVIEYLQRIMPLSDLEIAKQVQKSLTRQGLEFHLGVKVTGAQVQNNQVTLQAEGAEGPVTFTSDKVLVAAGRKPCIEGLGLSEAGVDHDPKTGRVAVNAQFETNLPGVYALGDLIHGPMLAHKAMEEGVAFAEWLAGQPITLHYDTIPSVIYIWPEVASVGPTEEHLKEQGLQLGRDYRVGKFPFLASGRAKCMDESEGMVKILTDARTDRLLAVHIFGPKASELIAEAVTVIEFAGSAEDIARIVHSHPTLSEAVAEAARSAYLGAALHA